MRIAPALPPKPLEQVVDRMAAYPGWGARDIAQGVFAFESFIEVRAGWPREHLDIS